MELITAIIIIIATLAVLYFRHYKKHIASRRYCRSNASLEGKTVVITGANSGIGKVTALDLARRGARVILACRNLQKAEDAAKEIKTRTGNSEVVVRHLDLARLQSVREFARKINEEEKKLDILINNAGIPEFGHEGDVTKDNFHAVFGTNHFGHFLLTNLLLDLLKKSAPSRVVTVSSNAHERVRSSLDLSRAVDARRPGRTDGAAPVLYPHLRDYAQSKLANILFSRELARRLESTGVTSVSLHPGVVFSSWWLNMKVNSVRTLVYYINCPIMWLTFIDEEAGAQTTLHCALDESVSQLPGRYFANCAAEQPSELARDDEMARRLWDVSCQATALEETTNMN
ncbi:retinol dehydrogenase 12-like [Patiria miniata]|uniref:Ketoreductase domain-containing protein n=1 Tax=Patiria miniata TaxID=46514 RepID=A0A914A4P4_PATMI|nr:retinol dehydrogenase 12-like [Patiria miniata]